MKRTVFMLLTVLLVAAIPAEEGKAQVIRIDTEIFAGKKFVNSAGDSLEAIPLFYEGSQYPEIRGQMPDSVRISWFALAPDDSIAGDLYFKTRRNNGTYSRTLVDSIKAQETDYKQIAATSFNNSVDELGVAFVARAAGNDASSGNKVYMRLERYFTKP